MTTIVERVAARTIASQKTTLVERVAARHLQRVGTADQLYADIKSWEEKLKKHDEMIRNEPNPKMAEAMKRVVDQFKEHVHKLRAELAGLIGKSKKADEEASISRPTPSAENQLANDGEKLFHEIKPGSRVTIKTPQGQERSGRAVMKGPHGWVLNMGGPHGTPGIASPSNIVKVK